MSCCSAGQVVDENGSRRDWKNIKVQMLIASIAEHTIIGLIVIVAIDMAVISAEI